MYSHTPHMTGLVILFIKLPSRDPLQGLENNAK